MLFKGENVATIVSYFKGLERGWGKANKDYFQSINRHSFGVKDKKIHLLKPRVVWILIKIIKFVGSRIYVRKNELSTEIMKM